MKSSTRIAARLAALALLPLALGACSKKLHLTPVGNEAPTVRLTGAPVGVPADSTNQDSARVEYNYAYKLNWVGYDPDGRVDHFLYYVDRQKLPPGQPIPWITTVKNESTFFFHSGNPKFVNGTPTGTADEFHIFSILAVDNQGQVGPADSHGDPVPVERAFFSFTQAPSVDISEPQPDNDDVSVTPFIRISWTGKDEDGVFTQKPVKYKFRLFKDQQKFEDGTTFDRQTFLVNPDSLRRRYAPTFAGWDSTGPDSLFATYSDLVPEGLYTFVVVAFDEAGAYSPVFSYKHNMLRLKISFAANSGPRINIFNEFFNYQYLSGGFPVTPSERLQRTIFLEVPAHRAIRFNWGADAQQGSIVKQYRWILDNPNLDDETSRSNEQTDWYHWSQWSLSNTSCTIGPFDRDSTHFFYVEAQDVNGLLSLGIVAFHVVVPPDSARQKPLVIVNDTRLLPDQKILFPDPLHNDPDSLQQPSGIWPSRAELDTFLFAAGGKVDRTTGTWLPGFRWRYTPDPSSSPPAPAVTMSYPGIFGGYDYDTIYTKTNQFPNHVNLSDLVRYRHVIWISDATGYNVANQPTTGVNALFVMSGPGVANTLSAYVILGGQVWGCGGGFLGSTMKNGWDRTPNNLVSPQVPRFVGPVGGSPAELVPGRFPFDIIHWQSEIWLTSTVGPYLKSKRLPEAGSWVNTKYGVSCPDYSFLPDAIRQKAQDETNIYNPDGTSRYPFRNDDMLQRTAWDVEMLPGNNNLPSSAPPGGLGLGANFIQENISTDPSVEKIASTLDTLMIVAGGGGLPLLNQNLDDPLHFNENVVMTYYHGLDCPPFLFTGFDIWKPARSEVIQLVDFVLQHMWGLTRDSRVDRNGFAQLRAAHVRGAHVVRR